MIKNKDIECNDVEGSVSWSHYQEQIIQQTYREYVRFIMLNGQET